MTQQYNQKLEMVAIPVFLAGIFSFLYLSKESIWLDEAYSIAFASLGWTELWSLITSIETNMSVYYLLLKLWIGIFGDSEFAVRSLSAILAVPAVALTYAIGRRLFDTHTGFIASVLIATNAFFIHYAQETRGYSLLLSLSALSMYLFIIAIEKREGKYYVLLGLSNALVLYAHFFGSFILLVQVVSILIAPKEAVRWRWIFGSFIIAGVLASPLGISLLASAAANYSPWGHLSKPSIFQIYSLIRALTGGGEFIGTVFYFLCCVISLVFAARKLSVASDRQFQWRYSTVLLWFILPIACLYLLSLILPAFERRYLITVLPALAMIAAVGIRNLRPKSIQYIAITLLVSISIYNVFGEYYSLTKRDWRTAAHLVLSNSQSGDAVLFYGWMAKYPFEYYYRRTQGRDYDDDRLICVWPSPFLRPARRENFDAFIELVTNYKDPSEESVEAISKQHDRLWVVLAMDKIAGMGLNSDPVIDQVEKNFMRIEAFSLKNITILYYVKRNDD